MKQWLFDISVRISPTLTRRCKDEAGRSEWAQSKLFEWNPIKSYILGWMDIQLCLLAHTAEVLKVGWEDN